MPRDIYNDGELVTDDLGRLWLVSALKTGVGLLMPELPDFLSQQEEKKSAVEGFEFDQMADGITAERERCAKIVDGVYAAWESGNIEVRGNRAFQTACETIKGLIRSRK